MGNKLFCSLALAASLPPICGCASTVKQPGAQKNWMEKTTSSVTGTVKSGSSMVASAFSPKRDQAPPVSSPNGKPGPAVWVAMAQMSERGENFDEAEAQYKKALDLEADNLGALIGYAHLEDRRNNLEAATKIYQRAAKKHPKEALIHNDFGLCYHRRGMLTEATKELRRAVELKGDNKLYRNNLAAVYVEQGKNKEALDQLIAAHGEAVGNYNLAYLLTQKQNDAAALVHFRAAAVKDPSLVAAQQWIAKLQGTGGQVALGAPGQQAYAPPAQQGPSAAFVAQRVGQEPSGGTFVRASNVSQEPQYPAGGAPAQNHGLQYPQPRPSGDGAGYAVPPTPGTPNGGRLPSVNPTSG